MNGLYKSSFGLCVCCFVFKITLGFLNSALAVIEDAVCIYSGLDGWGLKKLKCKQNLKLFDEGKPRTICDILLGDGSWIYHRKIQKKLLENRNG